MKGTVSYWNFEKKYGFIQDEEGGEFYFNAGRVFTNVAEIRVGSTVEFDAQAAPVGRPLRTAANVVVGPVDQHYFGKTILAETVSTEKADKSEVL
jgi:cold shock CspA family protein